MSWWTLEPHDPLMIRDGRPFGPDTEGARSMDFPTPSSIAGTLRSRIGLQAGGGQRFAIAPSDARRIEVAGPLLARLSPASLWLPAPRDVVLFDAPGGWHRFRLLPGHRWDEESSLPAPLLPVVPATPLPSGKPSRGAPAFWDLGVYRAWAGGQEPSAPLARADARGSLVHERRVHVGIDPATGAAADEQLFQTDGLRLSGPDVREQPVFLVRCEDDRLAEGMVTWGGERRLSALSMADPAVHRLLAEWSPPPVTERARVMLLTPALFAEGAVPRSILGATVVAAAVGRPLAISGWDMEWRAAGNDRRGGPKASRRCAPAGSVYWVEVPNERWAHDVHLRCVSDAEQDRRDGFGMAAVGVWE